MYSGGGRAARSSSKHRGVDLPFGALSDGYRAYIGLIGDMLFHLCEVCPPKERLTDLTGVVLIDECDFHLHPFLQRQLCPN